MALDTDVLKRAYLTPLAKPSATLRIFWPFMISYGIGSQLQTLSVSVAYIGNWGGPLFGFAMMLAAWPLFAAGAIRWHRWLVLDEPPTLLSFSGGTRLWSYFGRTVAVAAIAIAVLLTLAEFASLPFLFSSSQGDHNLTGRHVSIFFSFALLLVDVVVAAFLARFVLGLPIMATEDNCGSVLRSLGQPQRGVRFTLLAATVPLTGLYCIMAFFSPFATPDISDNRTAAIDTGSIALECFGTAMLDLLFFYTALVFLSALSFWYSKHERARLLAAAPVHGARIQN